MGFLIKLVPTLRALSSALLLTACAREALEPPQGGNDDAASLDAAAEEEAGPDDADATPSDAGQPPDSGQACSDADNDQHCDDIDNCPSDSNPDQADADGDGVGDACQPEAVMCDQPEALPESVRAGDATLRNVRINGSTELIDVNRGATFQLQLDFEFGSCTYPSQQRYINAGIEGAARSCFSLPLYTCGVSEETSGSTTITLQAPATPGTHYVVARGVQPVQFLCSDNVAGAIRVAAVCVK